MAEKKIMYQGDLKPDYRVKLSDKLPNGTFVDVDLTSASDIRVIGVLTVEGQTPVRKFDRSATGSTSDGYVTMDWQNGDTDTVGLLSTEVEVMWPGMKPQTFRPPELVKILPDFGGTEVQGDEPPLVP